MLNIVYIGLAGSLGAISRYLVSGWAHELFGLGFPYGTLVVNALGSLLLGFLMKLGISTEWLSPGLRVAATTGFLGAFTTFSTFSYETMSLVEEGAWRTAAGNVIMNLLLGLTFAWLGFVLARVVMGGGRL